MKVIDLICPFLKGGKSAVFGGAGTGKTIVIQELIRKRRVRAWRLLGLLRRRRALARGHAAAR